MGGIKDIKDIKDIKESAEDKQKRIDALFKGCDSYPIFERKRTYFGEIRSIRIGFVPLFIGCFCKRGGRARVEKLYFDIICTYKVRVGLFSSFCYVEWLFIKNRVFLKIMTKRVGGVFYKIPLAAYRLEGVAIILRWLRSVMLRGGSSGFFESMISELIVLRRSQGEIFKRRGLLHSEGLLNRGYIKFLKRMVLYKPRRSGFKREWVKSKY